MIDEVNKLAKYIGVEKVPQSWNIAFDKIKDDIPNEIRWLNKEYAESVLKYYRITDNDFKKEYFKAIDMINSNNYLKTLCYLWHYILYVDKTGLYKDVWNWKTSNELFKNAGNYMMPVVVLLSGNDFLIFVFQEKDLDVEYKNLREDTKLQRGLKQYLISNKQLHIGLGILK